MNLTWVKLFHSKTGSDANGKTLKTLPKPNPINMLIQSVMIMSMIFRSPINGNKCALKTGACLTSTISNSSRVQQ